MNGKKDTTDKDKFSQLTSLEPLANNPPNDKTPPINEHLPFLKMRICDSIKYKIYINKNMYFYGIVFYFGLAIFMSALLLLLFAPTFEYIYRHTLLFIIFEIVEIVAGLLMFFTQYFADRDINNKSRK